MARERAAGPQDGQRDGKSRDDAAEKNGGQDVKVNVLVAPIQVRGVTHHGEDNTGQPLRDEQAGKKTVGAMPDASHW